MINIELILTFENAKDYVKAVEQNEDKQEAWQKYMIEPFWADITKYAGRDLNFMKPAPIQDTDVLKKQTKILSLLSVEKLHSEFDKITAELPKDDDDPIYVALYPACDSDKGLKERQNGVVGCGLDGNVIININPLAQDYYDWILYVFAHEYHHGVFGHNWFVMRGGEGLNRSFYEKMIIEGQADLFAESLFQKLVPQWNRPFDDETESALWERLKTDPSTHAASMFGDESKGLPWCMGYALGRAIVSDYMQKNSSVSFADLIGTKPEDILSGSRFKF